ncbi:MAG TPA: hypothetical protein VET26_02685 [Candidatus Sulfotelmatobacter sp.]|nr:hypothetical protein [Candidatus Sulfotelmatobacter sp.]
MAITQQQWAPLAQNEILKFAILGSRGAIEINPVTIDDEGRDLEVHRRGRFGTSLSLQVKSSATLYRYPHNDAYHLWLSVALKRERVRSDPAYWYAIGYFSRDRLGIVDPVFLIPSAVFYRRCGRTLYRNHVQFSFQASLSPSSRDKWSAFKVPARQLGPRLLAILRDLERR